MRALLLALALTALVVAQGSSYGFLLVNRTGGALTMVAASPADQGQWADNSIPLQLEDGQSASIQVTPNPGSAPEEWDLQLTWADGKQAVLHDLRFEDLNRLTVIRDAGGNLTTLQE